MPYSVEFRPEAQDALRRLPNSTAQRILDKIKWLAKNCDQLSHEALSGEFKGLLKVARRDRMIIVHLIGHRRSVYER